MRTMLTLSMAAFMGTLTLAPLQADEYNKKTIITIDTPVQLPSTTLQPGTYTLKLLDSASDRHIVTVWDKDEKHLITTILAIPNYRLKPTGHTKFTFWETETGQPAALRAWFYPGDNFGQEFAYSKAKADVLSAASHATVPTLSASEDTKYGSGEANDNNVTASAAPAPAETTPAPAEPAPAPAATEPTPEPAPAPVAAAPAPTPTATAPEPEPAAAPAPAPEPAPQAQAPAPETPAPMPQTASDWNEMMSLGLLLSLTGFATFLARKSTPARR